ncbi:MAG: hypothetical protein H0U57_03035 [Tatlockia sp.]|nr:hypothetical protein [Tatlockia sp.]
MADPIVKEEIFAFRPKEKGAWFENYKASTNFKGKITCTDVLDTYEKNRVNDIEGFSSVKSPDDKSITEKLRGSEVAKEINKILKSEALDKKRKNFSQDIDNINQMLSGAKPATPNFSPIHLQDVLLAIKGGLVSAINKQHDDAKAKLEELFTKPEFKAQLLERIPGGNVEKIKEGMIETFDKTKTDELDKLSKAIEKNANELAIASRYEYERLSYITRKYNESALMKAQIDSQIREKNAKDGNGPAIVLNFGEGTAFFKNVDVNELKQFDTIQHGWISFFDRKIVKQGADGFHMELNRLYQSKDSIRMDVASLGQTMKACGYESVELNIQNKDPKKAESHARAVYEGMCVAGFDPKKITMKVNGEVKFKYDDKGVLEKGELFANKPKRLEYAQGLANRFVSEVDTIIKGNAESTTKLRNELKGMREQEQPNPQNAAI